jgi:GNAT superfamily N-acetyltransferase
MTSVKIFEPATPEHFAAIRLLFKEYYDFLYSLPNMSVHVDQQKPGVEIAELETGKYTAPSGALLLASHENEFTGVVALRRLTVDTSEMKRLYVRSTSRGNSMGYKLAAAIIQKGSELGYQKMRLDTHAAMKKAHALYYALGFYDITNYNQNQVPGAIFMEIDLCRLSKSAHHVML